MLEGEVEEDTEEEDEAREVEESEEEGEQDGEEEVAEDEAWTEAEEVTNEDREENGEKEEAEEADKAEDAEEVEEEPKEEEKPEEEEEMEELEGAEEAEEEEGEEEAEKQAVEEEAEVEEAKEEDAEEDVAEEEEALEALQSEMEPVNKQASRSYSRLKLRFHQRWQHHLEHQSALIRGIAGFWAKAFVNHPQMSAMIGEQDEGLLGYMMDLKLEELRFPRVCRKILLFFRKNPYFRNEVIVKEYVLSAVGYGPSHCTPIQWHQDYEREAYSSRHHNTSLNFFNLFSDHSFAGSSRIAEIILDDLWPNPLQYYVRKKASGEGTERRT
ncbi:testis-specific Y-encoded protein 3-like, partial [Neomonachus schauinslandi]|uniref:Testis-specific Y-encoded protein 3-like n=1 Tax=Neomonachus schauinslandi TaxID=29088 RepID=A0A8M1M300_NEOSC